MNFSENFPTSHELAKRSAANWRESVVAWRGFAARARALNDYGLALYADGEAKIREAWANEDEQRAQSLAPVTQEVAA